MDIKAVKSQLRVKTIPVLEKSDLIMVPSKHLEARQPNKEGVITGYVTSHGGEVWWVRHDDGTVGAYIFREFDPI